MTWWIWLGIVAAVVTILLAIDHWFRPVFRVLFLRLFKRGREHPPSAETMIEVPLPKGSKVWKGTSLKLQIPMPPANIHRMEISVAVEYVDGLPTAEQNIRKRFNAAMELKSNREYHKALEIFEECLNLVSFPEQTIALFNQIGDCYN